MLLRFITTARFKLYFFSFALQRDFIMSDAIKHECGIAFVRLLKPLQHYIDKYHTAAYAINKMYLLMEKQHNRGQDGAGIAALKLNTQPGKKYINRLRSVDQQPIQAIFQEIYKDFNDKKALKNKRLQNAKWLKENIPSVAEMYLGHLRYGTHGKNAKESCHPFIRKNNWRSRNLVVAGNFNLTNVDELIAFLVELGQHPVQDRDTVTVMEKIGHYLEYEVQRVFDLHKPKGYNRKELTDIIEKEINIAKILQQAAKDFDGGYVMAGMIGHGDAFILRDPNGIRPAFYYIDDEKIVVASERPAIQTTFHVALEDIKEIPPAHALIVRKDGSFTVEKCLEEKEKLACSFERIYFSRGTDKDIYNERKMLGNLLTEKILKSINYDYENTVFSFIPNTAETAFYGLIKGVEQYINKYKQAQIESNPNLKGEALAKLLNLRPRIEKIAIKDVKMRTFIASDASRDEMVSHVYDITYGSLNKKIDTLVIVDDSIVRGTTLQKSILSILDRLEPKKIIVVSSAPQIRYPDCYGIDMSVLQSFVAFRALDALLIQHNLTHKKQEIYLQCKKALANDTAKEKNYVKELYDLFTDDQISNKIAEIVKPANINAEVEVIFQSVEDLHKACPDHKGDWYFTGNFPTPGGNKVTNKAFVYYMEGIDKRAY